jgi:MFS superfamily sulfate permease-like transporter
MHNPIFTLIAGLLIGVLAGILIGLFWFGRAIIKQSVKMISSTYQGAGDEVKHLILDLFTGVMQKAVIETQDLETFEKKAIEEAQGAQETPKED